MAVENSSITKCSECGYCQVLKHGLVYEDLQRGISVHFGPEMTLRRCSGMPSQEVFGDINSNCTTKQFEPAKTEVVQEV